MIKDNDLYFAKVNPNAIIPSKRDEDGGYDVYACFDEDYMVIQPHETKLIPSGIATAFSPKWVAIIKERGSNGSKGIAQRCGVIDSGYRNEWFVPLSNTNDFSGYPIGNTFTIPATFGCNINGTGNYDRMIAGKLSDLKIQIGS